MRWLSWVVLFGLGALGAAATSAAAEGDKHPLVPGFERFHAQGQDALGGGKLLLGELNCTSCHKASDEVLAQLRPKPAPLLETVGSRVRPEYLVDYLQQPHGLKAGTTMPDALAGYDAKEKKEIATAIAHYLALSGVPGEQQILAANITKGDDLFHRIGCTACHDAQRAGAKPVPTSVPLGNLGAKYTLPGLTSFLQEPSKIRREARMPNFNLQGDEARNLASYLLRDLKSLRVPANLKFAYYEGDWQKLPDFDKLQPQAQGETSGFEFDFAPRKDHFAVRFTGEMQIAKAGEYKFNLGSDDGSRLSIDGKVIVDNDGIHGTGFKQGSAMLTAGRHKLTVDFFEQAGGEELYVQIEGNGLANQPVENLLVVDKPPAPSDKPVFTVDPALADKGKQLFASVGCASCHEPAGGAKPADALLAAPELGKLKSAGGCLSATPAKGRPHYDLNDAQRSALAQAIEAVQKPLSALSNAELISQTMKRLNCYTCHQRGDLGGVEALRDPYFLTTQKEMGDEGRLPPPLTGVGAKLRPAALKEQLEVSPKERPYMHTRMPRFATYPLGDFIEAVGKADPAPALKVVEHKFSDRELKQAGRFFAGSKGFSCIKCHTWGGVQATGIQAINMQRMSHRLRQEWFEAYILNPPQFRPGTRMPASWENGQVLLPKVLDGKADTQIRSLWTYLADGDKATMPLGLGRDPIELAATTEALMYRNFIEGAGPRAIGVAYPEKINLAYDANQMRLAMIWQGAFIDASKHWIDRGAGFQGPLGDNIVRFAPGVPLARLENETSPWPAGSGKELGYQFQGYRLDKLRRPTFMYKFGDVEVTDEPLPAVADGQPIFRRTLTFKTSGDVSGLWLRVLTDPNVKDQGAGVFAVDNWHLKVTGADKPVLRKSGNQQELLVPLKLAAGETKVVLEYKW